MKNCCSTWFKWTESIKHNVFWPQSARESGVCFQLTVSLTVVNDKGPAWHLTDWGVRTCLKCPPAETSVPTAPYVMVCKVFTRKTKLRPPPGWLFRAQYHHLEEHLSVIQVEACREVIQNPTCSSYLQQSNIFIFSIFITRSTLIIWIYTPTFHCMCSYTFIFFFSASFSCGIVSF